MTTWSALARDTRTRLSAAGIESAEAEARWILEHVGAPAAATVAGDRGEVPARAAARAALLTDRRAAGEPLQYVLGEWSFAGLDLFVDRRVLIPRPETEVVAEVAVGEAVRLGERTGRADPWAGAATTYRVADLGTGSGALALALACSLPEAEVWATDVSPDALAVARANLAGAGTPSARVRLASGSWFDALPADLRGTFLLVVSNPPYIAESELDGLPPEVRDHEPVGALVGGARGTEAIEEIVAGAPGWLRPDGALVCEIAPHQAAEMVRLVRRAGFADVSVRPDLAGLDRVLVARRS